MSLGYGGSYWPTRWKTFRWPGRVLARYVLQVVNAKPSDDRVRAIKRKGKGKGKGKGRGKKSEPPRSRRDPRPR